VYVSVTRVKTAEQPIENATIVAEEMQQWLREIEGFQGFLMLSRPGTTLGLSFWESREAAERHRLARRQFIERITAAARVEIEEQVDYDVTYADVGPLETNPLR
jgi:heme-degrading monooxygenase HmoA